MTKPEYVPRSAEERGLDPKTAAAIDARVARLVAESEPLDEVAKRRLRNALWPDPQPPVPVPRDR